MSIVKRLTRAEIESIYSAANSAVWHSHHFAARLAGGAPREEDYVATLVTDAVPLLADRWSSLLSPKGIALRISGVFCHGHPQVTFGSPRSQVELADLLVVHQHLANTRTTSRAILVQAKISATATHSLPKGDPQLALFSHWPKFEFVTGGLAPGLRDIKGAGKGSGYALVLDSSAFPEEISWADQCPWAACPASQLLSAEQSFAKLLGNMLIGKEGRAVRLRQPKDDWSRTIKELLEITGQKTYRRKNINRSSTPRLSIGTSIPSGTMFLTQSHPFGINPAGNSRRSVSEGFFGAVPFVGTDGASDGPPESVNRDDAGGGMSVLIIETWVVERWTPPEA